MSVRCLLVIAPLILTAGACAGPTAGEFIRRGDDQRAAQRYAAAAIEYRNAIKRDPASAEPQRKLAGTYAQHGKLAEAYRWYLSAIDLDAADVDSRLAASRLLFAAGRFDGAQWLAGQALAREPGNVEARSLAERALTRLRRVDEAVALASADGLSIETRLAVAHALLAVNDDEAAEHHLTGAIAAAPSSFDAHAMLAQVYAARGDLDRARVTLERFASAQPNAAAPRTALGMILEAAGRPAEARARYEQALALDSREPVASNNLARLYATDEARIGQALELARNAAARLPGDADVHDTLGWVAFRAGRLSLAASELERAVALNAAEPTYRSHLQDVRAEIAAAKRRSS